MADGLKKNALSILDTITLAVAGTAPSYTLNATTAALVAAVGLYSPAALICGAIPMFGISFAFKYLNEWRADAGAAYAWVGRSINPYLGFLSAWTFLVLSTVFMLAASIPMGVTTLALIAPEHQENVAWASGIGTLWFCSVTLLTLVGVHVAASFQKIMTGIEALVLLILAAGAVVKFSSAPVQAFSWSWFSPFSFTDFPMFMAGMLVSVFYFFGWDVTLNVAEESTDSNKGPGNSAVFGMVGIALLFLMIQVSVQMGMKPEAVEANSAQLLLALADAILPQPWGKIALLAVLLSTIGTIETQITQCSRLLFSMGRDQVVHEKFSAIHPRFQTPWLAGLVIMGLGVGLAFLSAQSESIGSVMSSLINSIGVMVSLYYGMAGVACTWYYRKTLFKDATTLFMRGIWPLGSAIFLICLAIYQLPTLGTDIALLTVAALVSGCFPMLYFRIRYKSAFYQLKPEQHSHGSVG